MQSIKTLFGDRVALELVEEEYEGLLVPAASEQKMYPLSRVLATGEKVKHIKVGDVVMWQWNQMIEHNNKFPLNGKAIFILQELDMIARLSSPKVSMETFEILGDWCLVRLEKDEKAGKILLPGTMQESSAAYTHFFLMQKGAGVDVDVVVGQEVIVDRSRANRIKIGQADLCYVQKPFVIGTYTAPGIHIGTDSLVQRSLVS